jgi:hypothetical protein
MAGRCRPAITYLSKDLRAKLSRVQIHAAAEGLNRNLRAT